MTGSGKGQPMETGPNVVKATEAVAAPGQRHRRETESGADVFSPNHPPEQLRTSRHWSRHPCSTLLCPKSYASIIY
uniref:Uncharacterized protein n=1 Tax=Ditylenchus dipsaci TaxID=166011 RepID=A0A915D5B7_9BILA